ncbi:MAG: IS21 family transposase, partial [Betaproteobacteria bacterium]|nr:IS21 family transposase [Betaproteobacteria bacterium]
MLSAEQINTIHRLHWAEKWPLRKIARHLHIGRRTLAKYLATPVPERTHRRRDSKLDSFKPAIAELLAQDPAAHAVVITQRLRSVGYDGGVTIVKDHLRSVRGNADAKRAYVRMEPGPGERFDIDWGHFEAIVYDGAPRKLYAFCLVECHSRKMYLEFTHSQSFETLARCHIHAFAAMGGIARELWYDNMSTVVAEHDGNLVRFHPRFLAFARQHGFFPHACHVAAAWEKGKVERAIGYVRANFWPLRSFVDLPDVNSQAQQWLREIANQRRHRETGQTPQERFRPECLRPLPAIEPDYRDSVDALVHKDLRLSFDGNRYCAPPRYVCHRLTVKADSSSVTLYDQHKEIVRYPRSWQRGQTFGAERFQKELFAQLAAAQRSAAQQRLVALLGPVAEEYLRRLADTDRSLSRQVRELLVLIREYGPDATATAISQAHAAGAFGADYIGNILRQQQVRRQIQPPLQLRDPELNQLTLTTMSRQVDQTMTEAAAANRSF